MIIVAAVIAVLVTALFFTIRGNLKMQGELHRSEERSYFAEREVERCHEKIMDLEKMLSYEAGLQDGRKTDTLYRQLLKKQTGGERFTMMMNGIKEKTT